MIYRLTDHHTIANQFIRELRHVDIQTDRMRFRTNLKRLGQIFAYEISKKLEFAEIKTPTVLGESQSMIISDQIVLATILRAGLPLHNGLLSYFDHADNAYISAYRKHDKDGSFEIKVEYLSSPSIEDKTLILSDPMLATGSSLEAVLRELKKIGSPKDIHIVTIIASSKGLQYIQEKYPAVQIWVGAEDPTLNDESYIVPGLGDAGDLAFGEKIQNQCMF